MYLFVRLFIYRPIYSFICLLIYFFIHSLVHLLIYHLLTHLFISTLRRNCLSLGLCDVLYRAIGRFSHNESVTAACYMAFSSMLSTTRISSNTDTEIPFKHRSIDGGRDGDRKGNGEEGSEVAQSVEKNVDSKGTEIATSALVDYPDKQVFSPSLTPSPLSSPSASLLPSSPSSSVLSSSQSTNLSTNAVNISASTSTSESQSVVVLADMRRRLSSLGLGPLLIDTLRLNPSSAQVSHLILSYFILPDLAFL